MVKSKVDIIEARFLWDAITDKDVVRFNNNSNDNGKLTIRKCSMERKINGISTIDLIVKQTDGRESSIKKYNSKTYRSEKNKN